MMHKFVVVYGAYQGDMEWLKYHCDAPDAAGARAQFKAVHPNVWLVYISLA